MNKSTVLIWLLIFSQIFNIILGDELTTKGLHIKGNNIYNENNQLIMLRGVNRPGTEYNCVQRQAIFDGPHDLDHLYKMRDWKINAVRIPMNEDCWLGRHGDASFYFGDDYRYALKKYIAMYTDNNMAVILDLHWSSNGSALATQQIPMPGKDGAVEFWKEIATTFKDNSRVLFDVYNEPFPFQTKEWDDDEAAWACWKDGTGCSNDPEITYEVAGMQQLVNAIRLTGSKNIILLPGIQYASSVTKMLAFLPNDPVDQMGVSLHSYDFNHCNNAGCWDKYLKPVYTAMPIVATETGQKDCQYDFLTDFLHYADQNNIHYFAWAWLAGKCSEPSLITDFDGEPSGFGVGFKNHLAILAKGKTPWWSDTFDIYNDKLTHWVDDWSLSDRNFKDTTTVKEGRYSLSTTCNQTSYLYFQCFSCIKTDIHKTVEFWINGGEMGGQSFNLELIVGNAPKEQFPISDVLGSSIPAGKWVKAIIDLTKLPKGQKYDGLWLRPNSDQSKFFLDQITVRAIYEPPKPADEESSIAIKLNINLLFNILIILSTILLLINLI